MSGHVGIIANDAGRYTMFSVCLSQLRAPVNTTTIWRMTNDRMLGRNGIVQAALEVGTEWLMFLDDDHTFPPDILMQLLSHDVPVVGALYLQRQPPFGPIAYSSKNEEEGTYKQIALTALPERDLVQVRACGTGGMLIRSEVLRAMQEPWFEYGGASEDLIFCDRVYELGLGPIYVDTGVRMGHLAMSAMWPTYSTEDDKWRVGFQLADGYTLEVGVEEAEPIEV